MSQLRRGVSLTGSEQMYSDVPGWKRYLDLVVILMTLPIVAPLMLFIAVSIKCASRGPIFFKQKRIGLNGQEFTCLKFRTMHVNAPTTGHQNYLKDLIQSGKPMIKMDSFGDTRLIRGARWMRSSGLDELPQLINVWRGEMSWVGPRPGTLSEFEDYTDEHKGRLRTLPGLTGLWQVSGKNGTTFDEMVRLDIWYANHKTLWLDLKIMAKTPLVLLGQCHEVWSINKRQHEKPREHEKSGVDDKDSQQKHAVSVPVAL